MSTLKSKAYQIFQLPPCDKNDYISFNESEGMILAVVTKDQEERSTMARNKILRDYDSLIKEKFGDEHFHGEQGLPLAPFVRDLV